MNQPAGSARALHDSGQRIDDRYRVESLLGQGGMAAVYAVVDESSGRSLALKRLLPVAKPKHRLLFEREYHVLASLSHPHIVRAFEFGTDAEGPFYTMELLRGTDLEALAPCPWTKVCAILAELTSALAVLHARRLLHRDVSARNVWITEQGQSKLIDFGTLIPFGPAADIAGTPPFLAPEGLRTQQLDQRSDLYSVGALGYYLLTKRHAYPARRLGELEHHWTTKPPPASARLASSDIPAALDALIESMLSLDPGSRPQSAAELLDRLTAIAPLPRSAELHAIEGSLGSKSFVGRSRERRKVRVALTHALDGLSANFCVEGAQGIGCSRFLAEVGIEARVAGSVVIETSAQVGRDLHSAATVCATKLLDAVPALARKAIEPHARVIGHLSDALREKLELTPAELEPMPPVPGEARLRIQTALSDWFLAVSRQRALTLVVDDLDALDEASAAFVAALARESNSGGLVIVASVHTDTPCSEPAQAFVQTAQRLKLEQLREEQVCELLQSVFGDTAHLARLVERAQRATQGNPGHVMELAQYLVREGIARYVEGTWVLPADIADLALPASSDEVVRARLTRLSRDAQRLGQALSTLDGLISLDACAAVGDLTGAALYAALEELVREGVLSTSGDGYEFAHDVQRRTLQAELDPERARRVHRLIGEWLLQRADLLHHERLQAGVHLLRAHEFERGSRVVGRAAIDFAIERPEQRRPAIAQLEQALRLLRERGASDHQLVGLLGALGANSYVVDRRLALEYGEEALERLERVLCLDTARALRRFVGARLSLLLALAKAALRFRRFRRDPLVPTLREAMALLMSCTAALAGTFTLCIDTARVLRCAQTLEPFSALGTDHVGGIFYAYCTAFAATVQDRFAEANARLGALVQRLSAPKPIKGMPDQTRKYCLAGALYAYGVSESWRDGSSKSLAIADLIEQQPIKLYRVSADQIRTQYYAQRGDLKRSNEHRQRVELCALQRGTTWQVDVAAPGVAISACTRTRDALRLKQAIEQLRHLSKDTPSLTEPMRRARGTYLLLQERYEEALTVLEEQRRTSDRRVVGWARMLAGLARAYRGVGQPQKAKEACLEALQGLTPADLEFVAQTLAIPIELALAEAELGNVETAAAQLDALLAKHAPGKGPLTLGELHAARAQVAVIAGDASAEELHFGEMERWYAAADAPSLHLYCDSLARARSRRGRGAGHADGANYEARLDTLIQRVRQGVDTSLREPSAWTLEQVTRYLGSDEAFGFVWQASQVRCLARHGTEAVPEDITKWVEGRLHLATDFTCDTEDVAPSEQVDPDRKSSGEKTYRLTVLRLQDTDHMDRVVGALVFRSERPMSIPSELMRAVAERFDELRQSPPHQLSV